ncbi:hypothetical protein BP6252_10713 [Coleophoma cylindrospora]|uniref:Nephrocystin 3-like N-terminal domain-containing protein n=1 Tax=Coleophoma cylindrospora TaxID=1849047 RepID=A0A3D8QTG0_9HELO|nr:hypothetical protein BP6252_10713 [Coleophoma cylindrospora]
MAASDIDESSESSSHSSGHRSDDDQNTGDDHEASESRDDALDVLWTSTQHTDESSVLDFVVVRRPFGDNYEDSLDTDRLTEYAESLELNSRIVNFNYTLSDILCGFQSAAAIRSIATSLLSSIKSFRTHDETNRPLMFLGKDIGSIIIKAAQVIAFSDLEAWGDISDYSRILLFSDCPHQSYDRLEMEDKLGRFLFGIEAHWKFPNLESIIASTPGLASAIVDINGEFIRSKIPLRCHLISSYEEIRPSDDIKFDEFDYTMRVPFERRFGRGDTDSYHKQVIQHLRELQFVPAGTSLSGERMLLHLASIIHPLATSYVEDFWLKNDSTYQTWLDTSRPQLLHLFDTTGYGTNTRFASDQVFYHLENISKKSSRSLILYFDFKPWNSERRTLSDMLTTLITQIFCHYPTLYIIEVFFRRTQKERGWSEADLMKWFEYCTVRVESIDDLRIILHQFDECDASSRKVFVDLIARDSEMFEVPWKILVTSRKPGELEQELLNWPTIEITQMSGNLIQDYFDGATLDTNTFSNPSAKWFRFYRLGDQMQQRLVQLKELEPIAHSIVWHQLKARFNAPQEAIDFLSVVLEPWEDPVLSEPLASIVDRVLRYAPNQRAVRRALMWLSHTMRPLSMKELVAIISIDNEDFRNDDDDSANGLIFHLEQWFAGIIDVRYDQVYIRHAVLKEIIRTRGQDGPDYIWRHNTDDVHLMLAKDCLKYISQKCAQNVDEISSFLNICGPSPVGFRHGIFLPYAIQFWFHHLKRTEYPMTPATLAGIVEDTDLGTWSKLYWAMSNPITRSQVHWRSPFPLLASWGYVGLVEPSGQEDLDAALNETALNGRVSVVSDLLHQNEFSRTIILEAVRASVSSGDEELILQLMDRLTTESKDEISKWGPDLLFRASRLDFDQLADALLNLGCPSDCEIEYREGFSMTPLWLCALSGSASTAKVLVNHKADVEYLGLYNRTPLECAAGLGFTDIVTLLVEEGKANIEHQDNSGCTPLYDACIWANYKAAAELLRLGADPNFRRSNGWTPIMCAADDGYNLCLQALLDNGANVDEVGPNGIDSPLRYAAVSGHMDTCRLLLNSGADPNNSHIEPPILIEIMKEGNSLSESQKFEMIKLMLDHGANIDATDKEGNTVLKIAVEDGHSELVDLILKHDPDVNVADNEQRTALYEATVKQDASMVRQLLEKGANANLRTSEEKLPLHLASSDSEINRLLAEKTANIDAVSPQGITQLMLASSHGWQDCVNVLIEHKADVNAVVPTDNSDWVGWTPIYFAAVFTYPEVVTILAEAGADLKHTPPDNIGLLHSTIEGSALPALLQFHNRVDLNQVDDEGRTALHYSARITFENMQHLIRAGIKIDILEKYGRTALCMAVSDSRSDLVPYLLKHGSDPNLAGTSPDAAAPPLHQACRRHLFDVVKMLTDYSADVNFLSVDFCETPLIATCLQYSDNKEQQGPEIIQHLLDLGADVNGKGKHFGSPLNAASWCMGPETLRFLLEKGATIDAEDCIGRKPIHFAALHGGENFNIIREAGGDIATCDKLGRSALHWAAQTGRVQVVKEILSLMQWDVVNKEDIDGWTPLCWAVRGVVNFLDQDFAGEDADQIGMVKLLLEKGAHRFIECAVGEQKRTPLQLARYYNADQAILDLLEDGLEGNEASKSDDASPDDGGRNLLESKTLHLHRKYCDSCLWEMKGRIYQCKICYGFYFCDKCYFHRAVIHAGFPDHAIKEIGPEFDELSETGSSKDDDSSSITTSTHSSVGAGQNEDATSEGNDDNREADGDENV